MWQKDGGVRAGHPSRVWWEVSMLDETGVRVLISMCPVLELPGQLDGLLRASLPGKTVTGQDPASLDRLDLVQRGQGPVVIFVHEPGGQLRPGLAAGKAERRQRVAHDQDVTVSQAQGHVSRGVA